MFHCVAQSLLANPVAPLAWQDCNICLVTRTWHTLDVHMQTVAADVFVHPFCIGVCSDSMEPITSLTKRRSLFHLHSVCLQADCFAN